MEHLYGTLDDRILDLLTAIKMKEWVKRGNAIEIICTISLELYVYKVSRETSSTGFDLKMS